MSSAIVVGSALDSDRTYGALFVGFIISTILYGLTFFQTYNYFSCYPKDAFLLRALIGTLWALDTASTGLLSHALYNYLITDFGLSSSVLNVPRTLCAENVLTVVAIFLIHLYYVTRVWSVGRRNVLITGAVGLLASATFVFGTVSTLQLFQKKTIESFFHDSLKTWMSLNTGLAFLCDMVITTTLCFYLSPSQNLAVKLPESQAERAIEYALNRGTISAVVQLAYFLAFVFNPAKQIWVPFFVMIARVYVNVLLVMLNYRDAQDGRGVYQEEVASISGVRPTHVDFDTHMAFGMPSAKTTGTSTSGLAHGDVEHVPMPMPVSVDAVELDNVRGPTQTENCGKEENQRAAVKEERLALDVSKGG